ncbi:MAG: Papain family cysteine protease [Bacteroidetes bacterium ADurb.Bin174]|nr:MAG: Papain family cysteine protease [Bacteroidetes bacterium ADurb.Bin174]
MKLYIINILIGILIVTITSSTKAENINLNKTFRKDSTIFVFNKTTTINNLELNAIVNLTNERSLVRVVLGCSDNKEYLVYEAYSPLTNIGVFKINGVSDETEFLNDVKPIYLKILITEAEITIQSIKSNNNKASNTISSDISTSLAAKRKIKSDMLNQNLVTKKAKWRAGITSLSKMSYMDKKLYFGVEKYNSFGLEYYNGGIFEFKDYDSNDISNMISKEQSLYIDHFDWREKHGANNPLSPYYTGSINGWVSPIKTQWASTCWAYSAVGLVETFVNLYYNQNINLDLSEHDVVSCSGAGSSSGGWPAPALNYIKDIGVVDESCFPNPINGIQLPCTTKCINPLERIKIENYINGGFSNEDGLKSLVIKSPMTFIICCSYICHATVVVGYRTIKEGDIVWHSETESGSYITIQSGDPLIGRTCWIIKNSGGSNNATLGYSYYVIDNFNYILKSSMSTVYGPINSLQFTDNDIKCVDLDGDGYYNWGIGSKPASCPSCVPDEKDGDDSNSNLGPIDSYGFCQTLTSPISYPDVTITSNTTWNTKNTLCGNLVIANGATLTVSDKLVMPINSTITVLANSKLVVDGGTITYANIVAENGSELTLQNNALLQLYKNDELNIKTGAIFNNDYGDIQILSSY